MLCDGQCTKKNKRCGLLAELWMENAITKEKEKVDKCIFLAILESLFRLERHQDGLHAAFNSLRNENVKSAREQKQTIAEGFLGLIYSMHEDDEHREKVIKKIKNLGSRVEKVDMLEN